MNSVRKEILSVGIPLSVTSIMYSLMSYIDMFMISSFGSEELSAVGLASRIVWINISIMTAITASLSIFLPRHIGTKSLLEQQKSIRFSIHGMIFVSILLSIIQHLLPDQISILLTSETVISSLCSEYLRATSIINILIAITMLADTILRCHKVTKYIVTATFFEVIFGVTLNYILIFGHLGFEPMGLSGAAIGTVVSKLLRAVIGLYYLLDKFASEYLLGKAYKKETWSEMIGQALPILFTSVSWSLGLASYHYFIAKSDLNSLNLHILLTSVEGLFIALVWGLCTASGIIFAQNYSISTSLELSRLKSKIKQDFLALSLWISLSYSIIMVLMFKYNSILSGTENIEPYEAITLFVSIFFLKCCTMFNFTSILQSCGDSKNNFKVNFIAQWIITIPVLYILVTYTNTPYSIFLIVFLLEETMKLLISNYRTKFIIEKHSLPPLNRSQH